MKKNNYVTLKCRDKVRIIHRFVLILALVFIVPVTIFAQGKSITGLVTDSKTGEPLIGVSVAAEGTTTGTITDIEGRFSLNVPQNSTLKLVYMGYITQSVQVGNQTNLNIKLVEDSKLLDEVVVVGFGTQKKVNLTGAVGIATAKDIQDRPVMLATQALQGLVPGLNISQNNGSLESRASINIRGTGTIADGSKNSPLILIDGMEGDINALNPQDIENISVLKDASSSSIYGSRAPFGVILITTKKGTVGKTVVNYNNSFRWNKPILMPQMMDSYTFANYFNDAALNGGGTAHFSDAWLANILAFQRGEITTSTVQNRNNNRWEEGFDPNGINNTGGNDNRDYYKEIFRSQSMGQEHNFSISGGNEKVTYYTSFNILAQDGLMQFNQDTYDRYAATAKVGYDAASWVRVNYTNRFIRDKYKRPSAMTDGLFGDLGRQAWPTLPLYDPNGFLMQRTALALRNEGNDRIETDNLYQQIQFVFEPIKHWKTFAEVNYAIKNANRHWDKQVTYMYDVDSNPFVWSKNSNVHEDHLKENQSAVNLYTEYTYTVNKNHNFKGMLGIQSENMKQTKFGLQRDGILVPGINEIDGTSGTDYDGKPVTPSVNGSRQRWSTFGYFTRINYDYQGRYLAEFNLRNDGSSRYRSHNRWVWSPSFSLGWNIAQEDFWKPLQDVVGTLKLRGSYGQLANQNTDKWYPTYAAMTVKASEGAWMQNGIKPNVSWAPLTLIDENLTWEKIRTTNIGLDFGLLNNRLTGSFDYFVRETRDMLGPAPERPVILGVTVPRANNTDLQDKGFELQIAWQDRLKNGLGYGVRFNLADYQTTITRYPNLTGNLGARTGETYNPNQKMGEIWGYETIGIAKTQAEMDAHLATLPNGGQDALGNQWGAGDIMYKDIDGDGKINNGSNTLNDHGDLKVIGNTTPRYQFGFELTADWKGFDMRAFFQGIMKRDFWNGNYFFWGAYGGGDKQTDTGGSGMWWSTGFIQHEDYFRDANTNSVVNGVNDVNLDSYYPRPLFNSSKNTKRQTRYLQDASYIRLKNLQIGYTLPTALSRKLCVSKLRVFVSGENLWTKTDMAEMFDPETVDGGWGNSGNVYPLSKVFAFGLNINF
ncbi:TonB-linked SusC/RagA family outer membrane protein [Dysgonomonas alginatilytica]|uniref:TonB-linked SusC/RagA family outer membrane protein n=1 Tax=Dysgonomonas alginatilytica TaxID=1605892 RepID=A0A2V3PLK0_9BACT|nr:TonB-dependent receptor [Dysgonomonas alginatilytica]PXV61005.1 TonB-linked SusC/RagA family outer membrane protein [Dysgonomonas alginatilytica]